MVTMADKKQDNNPNGLLVGNVGRGQSAWLRLKMHWKPLLAGLVVIVLAAGGGVFWWFNREKPQPSPEITVKSRATLDALRQGTLNASDPASQARLQEALNDTSDKGDKTLLYSKLAENAAVRKDYPAQVDSLIKAYENGLNDSTALLAIADAYENNLQDYNNALKYYKLALAKAQEEKDQGDPFGGGQARYAQESIARMEAKGAR
jgi:tetratricopeptide (TPR) repeat protein